MPYTLGGGSGNGGGSGEEEPPETTVSLEGFYENDGLFLSIAVNGSNATTFIPLFFDMNIPDDLIQKINEIHQGFTTPLEGSIEVGTCAPPSEDNPEINQYLIAQETSYSENNFKAINQAINLLDNKITAVHKDVCLAIDPPIEIPEWIPTGCEKQETIVDEVTGEIIDVVSDYLSNSIFSWLLGKTAGVGGIKGVALHWFISYMGELIFNQQKQADQTLCLTNQNLSKIEDCLTEVKELINKIEPVAAVPDWWSIRVGADRPTLVIIYGEKGTTSRWSLSIPHYIGGENGAKHIPSYTKGNFWTVLILKDNSKVVVNASSKSGGEAFIKKIKRFIAADLLKGSVIRSGGERKGDKLRVVTVIPIMAKFFSTGQKNIAPDWTYIYEVD